MRSNHECDLLGARVASGAPLGIKWVDQGFELAGALLDGATTSREEVDQEPGTYGPLQCPGKS